MNLHYRDQGAAERIAVALLEHTLTGCHPLTHIPVLVMVGTDTEVYDCMGPLAGDYLSHTAFKGEMYGSLADPIDITTIKPRLRQIDSDIRRRHGRQPYLVVVDAALGSPLGLISVRNGGFHPGGAVGDDIGAVGDLHVLGATWDGIRKPRLHQVTDMARVIASAVCQYQAAWDRRMAVMKRDVRAFYGVR